MGEYIEVARALRIPAKMMDEDVSLRAIGWYKPRSLCAMGLCRDNHSTNASSDSPASINTADKSESMSESSDPSEASDAAADEPDFALVLLGGGSYFSDSIPGGVKPHNVYYDWYDLSYLNTEEHTVYVSESESEEKDKDKDRGDNKVDVGVTCSNRMFVAFVAARDIARGEELVVPLLRGKGEGGDGSTEDNRRYTSAEFASQCM
jgi:hypothetical protein